MAAVDELTDTPETAPAEEPTTDPATGDESAGSDDGHRRTRRTSPPRSSAGKTLTLPVLVVDETVLLPHMSIPFPIEDDEAAMVIERASRLPQRLVLVLTERVVPPGESADEGGADHPDEAGRDEATAAEEAATRAVEAESDLGGQLATDEDADWLADGDITLTEYELCSVGVIAEVGQRMTRPGGEGHVILQGVARGIVQDIVQYEPYPVAKVERHDDATISGPEAEAAMSAVLEQVESYISMLPNVPEEVLATIRSVEEPGWLADLIAFSPEFTAEQRQELLEVLDPVARLRRLSVMIQKRLNVLSLRQQIQHEAQAGMDKQQREYFLREQLRAIQKELGEGSPEETLANELRQKIEAAGMPEDVKEKALLQVERLAQQHPFSPEIGVIRSYLEWLVELPWSVTTEDRLDLAEAERILHEDHYGLEKVKDRILEYIAVRKLAGDRLRAPIICFVGPPGVGKTSLGRSIARAMGRHYARMSLGGVRDEAEIRGHRRTYVGAMPGRVIKALRDAKSKNPVLVLDEIDKLGADTFRGDPSSALLEVLDPEQNSTFSDHYLEVPFDLSKVMFITTANMLDPIPLALRDRMEIIEVPGYTEIEKMAIARSFLLPKALHSHGLSDDHLQVTDDALRKVIREYTEESGVRNLERELGSLARKVARKVAASLEERDEASESAGDAVATEPAVATLPASETTETPVSDTEHADEANGEVPASNAPEKTHVEFPLPDGPFVIDADDVEDYLGIPRYEFGLAEQHDEVGVATGAAVTSVGGDLLSIEVLLMEGKGDLLLTGHLGEVMQESARAAISYARSRAESLGLEPGYFDKHNIHIHIPAGATPKDGPSAGITMATALISALTGRKVRKDVAMTGEITLRGKVLPIGGLREKTLAAHRGGIRTFILPRRNAKDVSELPDVVKAELELIQVDSLDEVLEHALVPQEPVKKASVRKKKDDDERQIA